MNKLQQNNQLNLSEAPRVEKIRFCGTSQNCTLMIRSQNSLYSYWKISKLKRSMVEHHLNSDWNSFQLSLRLYEVTDVNFNGHNADHYFEYQLSKDCQEWFFYDLTSNRRYCVDIGVVTNNNYFFPIIRSNTIKTPRGNETNVSSKLGFHEEKKNKEPEWVEAFSSYSYYEKT